ncbi:MAG: aldo/keto reductase [Thermodesulfobacteriota bacterium]|nr:aldo/keto reductase [Thermodesulfobacteriota bacterium]
MLYREIPKTGDQLSILGFGCMRLPAKKGRPGEGKIDEARATRQIRYAIDHGVNYLDTAMPYHMGASEPFLGRALADGYREKVKLATKQPHWLVKTRQDMDRILNAQLKSLQIETIDYYLIHNLWGDNWERLLKLGVIDFLDTATADGRIGNAGFSTHAPLEQFKSIVDGYDWAFCQIQYNFMDEQHQAGTEGLKYAAARDLGIVIMEPLRGGNLVGKVPEPVQAIWNEANIKRSPAEWALRWVWNHPEVTVVLSGMNEEAHIDENLAIAANAAPDSLTPEELALFSRVETTYRRLMKAPCTGCQYCMPCPEGVDIPGCFDCYNRQYMYNDPSAVLFYIMHMAGIKEETTSLASQCVACGKCTKKCPQGLPIPDLLKDVAEDMEGRRFKIMRRLIAVFFTFQRWGSLMRSWRPFGS